MNGSSSYIFKLSVRCTVHERTNWILQHIYVFIQHISGAGPGMS